MLKKSSTNEIPIGVLKEFRNSFDKKTNLLKKSDFDFSDAMWLFIFSVKFQGQLYFLALSVVSLIQFGRNSKRFVG